MSNKDDPEPLVQEWLDQRTVPPFMSEEEAQLFNEYRSLGQRLKNRQLPSLPTALANHDTLAKCLRQKMANRRRSAPIRLAWRLAAVVLLIVTGGIVWQIVSAKAVSPTSAPKPQETSDSTQEHRPADGSKGSQQLWEILAANLPSSGDAQFDIDFRLWHQDWYLFTGQESPAPSSDLVDMVKEYLHGTFWEIHDFLQYHTCSNCVGERSRRS